MIAVPHLKVQVTRKFLLRLVLSENREFFSHYHKMLPTGIRNSKDETPIEVPLAVQRVIMDICLLLILVEDPSFSKGQKIQQKTNWSIEMEQPFFRKENRKMSGLMARR